MNVKNTGSIIPIKGQGKTVEVLFQEYQRGIQHERYRSKSQGKAGSGQEGSQGLNKNWDPFKEMKKRNKKKKKNRKIIRKSKKSSGLKSKRKNKKSSPAASGRLVRVKAKKKNRKKVVKKKASKPKVKKFKKRPGENKKRKFISKRAKTLPSSGGARYYLNPQFQYIDELKDLVLKSSPEEKEKMTENLHRLGRVKLAIATGIFLNKVNAEAVATDLFIVGDDINRRKLRSFLKSLEADVGKEIRYVVMEKEEFQYRVGMFDRFIRVLLEGPHEKLINKLGL